MSLLEVAVPSERCLVKSRDVLLIGVTGQRAQEKFLRDEKRQYHARWRPSTNDGQPVLLG